MNPNHEKIQNSLILLQVELGHAEYYLQLGDYPTLLKRLAQIKKLNEELIELLR